LESRAQANLRYKHRKDQDDIKTGGYAYSREKCEGHLPTVRMVSGVEEARLQPWLSYGT
jgi:hypothetical protein